MHIGSLILLIVAGVVAVSVYGLDGHSALYAISGFLGGIAIYMQLGSDRDKKKE